MTDLTREQMFVMTTCIESDTVPSMEQIEVLARRNGFETGDGPPGDWARKQRDSACALLSKIGDEGLARLGVA